MQRIALKRKQFQRPQLMEQRLFGTEYKALCAAVGSENYLQNVVSQVDYLVLGNQEILAINQLIKIIINWWEKQMKSSWYEEHMPLIC